MAASTEDPLDQLPDTPDVQPVPLSLASQHGLLSLSGAAPTHTYDDISLSNDMSNLASISLDVEPEASQQPAADAGSDAAPVPAAVPPPPAVTMASSSASSSGAAGSAHAAAAAGEIDAAAAASVPKLPVAPEPLHRAIQPDIPIKVWVRDPEKVERSLAMGSYVSWLVKTECSSGALGSSPADLAAAASSSSSSSSSSKPGVQAFEVRRRFSDFDVLHRLLKRHYRGYFLPPLPDKQAGLFAGDNFLAVRKVDLQAYMCTVANHPALQSSAELLLFLTAAGDLSVCEPWQTLQHRAAHMEVLLGLLRPHDSSSNSSGEQHGGGAQGQAAGGGGGSFNMMLRMKHSLLNVVQPRARPELPAEEKVLVQAKERLKELHQHLTACVGAVRSLVSHLESVADDFNDLGRSFSHLARWEEHLAQSQGQYTPAGSSAVQRAADLQLLGYSALRQHTLEKQFVLRTGASLVFLHDWYVLIPEAIGTLQEREDVLAAVQLLHEELLSKQAAATKTAAALGPAAAGDKRHLALLASINSLQDKLLAARQQYQLLRERNESELLRLNLQRAIDFRTALARFAAVQAQAAQAAAGVWTAAAEQLAQEEQQQQQPSKA